MTAGRFDFAVICNHIKFEPSGMEEQKPMAYYQESVERMSREALRKLQSERLVKQVKRMYERVECFRKRMDELNLRPEDIHGIEDLPRLPQQLSHLHGSTPLFCSLYQKKRRKSTFSKNSFAISAQMVYNYCYDV